MENVPTYSEAIRLVEMGPLLGPAYRAFEQEITRRVKACLAGGDSAPLLPWFKALLLYADMPWLGWTCRMRSGAALGSAPALPSDTVYPIEQALIDYVSEQIWQAQRPTIVFTENTGTFEDLDRLQTLIEQHARGLANDKPFVSVLYGAMSKHERQEWLGSCAQDGVQVLICNPVLLIGLDPGYFKRIAFKRVPTQLESVQKAARCLITPTQDGDVQTAYFAYRESMALRLLTHYARLLFGGLPGAGGTQVGSSAGQRDESLLEISTAIIQEMEDGQATPQTGC